MNTNILKKISKKKLSNHYGDTYDKFHVEVRYVQLTSYLLSGEYPNKIQNQLLLGI